MTTILRTTTAAQFLALLPAMLGCTPTRSLVLVPFAHSRSVGAMRVDLADDGQVDQLASTCIGMVCRLADVDELTAVVYTDQPLRSGDDEPAHARLAQALAQRADACGLHLRDALCVAADAWGSYLDPECPPAGHDLAELVPDARAPVPPGDQHSGVELPEVAAEAIAQTATALEGLDAAVAAIRFGDATPGPARIDPRALVAACRLDDMPALFEEALGQDPADLDAFTAALLVWTLSRPATRDVALIQWSDDQDAGDAALQAQLDWEDGAEYPPDLGERMWGDGARPDPDRLRAALELTRHVAARAPAARRAGPLSMCGWLAWALGRSTHAAGYAQSALECEPGHGLAEIVLSLTAAGHLPAWAFTAATP
ncbi:hypothetical protein GCM10022240_30610 [Microbacterium kribbense]|uniref:DUF4192 family protein n=1 Tax=Microbacterium kribbense TaxID=433645 RepID=A0ABP7GWS2_9MICO